MQRLCLRCNGWRVGARPLSKQVTRFCFSPDADDYGQITKRQQQMEELLETCCPGATAYLLIDGEIPINLLHLLTKHIDNSLNVSG